MTKAVIFGYGKDSGSVMKYVKFGFRTAKKAGAETIITTGGDTSNESNNPWLAETEAEMMGNIIRDIISLTGRRVKILEEKRAYNTLTNVLYIALEQMIDETEKVIIVCNKAHFPKVFFATVKVLGLRATMQRISFHPFPLTTGKIENLMILAKTVPEVLGYFIRPLGRRIEWIQYNQRTGRNKQLTYKEFCSKFRKTGELI